MIIEQTNENGFILYDTIDTSIWTATSEHTKATIYDYEYSVIGTR